MIVLVIFYGNVDGCHRLDIELYFILAFAFHHPLFITGVQPLLGIEQAVIYVSFAHADRGKHCCLPPLILVELFMRRGGVI